MPDFEATWSSAFRRLVVITIYLVVATVTVLAVQRPFGGDLLGGSVAGPADGTQVLRSGSRVPPVSADAGDPSTGRRDGGTGKGSAGSGKGRGDQVPARPAEAIDGLLQARAAAIRDGDKGEWLAGLAQVSGVQVSGARVSGARVSGAQVSGARISRFRTAQAAVFDRVRSLRPVSWTYQVAGGYPLPAARRAELGTVAWLADVQLDYRLTAGGPTVRRQQFLTIVQGAGGWLIADDTDGQTGRDLWDLGPVARAGSARCLVIGAGARRAQVEQFAAECAGSARTVDRAWGRSWPRRTVLTVPNTVAQLAVLLGRSGAGGAEDTAGLEKTAAVTIGPSDGAADTVLINGAAFDELSAVGRRVVLTHELVHVATRATGSRSAPTWLVEGYADYVAYADTGLTPQQVAGEALDEVRAGQVPAALPAADDFNAAGDRAPEAYGLAWVAAGLIADRAGDPQLMQAFYRRAAAADAGAAGLDRAFAGVGLGGTEPFVTIWQNRLRQLAR